MHVLSDQFTRKLLRGRGVSQRALWTVDSATCQVARRDECGKVVKIKGSCQ